MTLPHWSFVLAGFFALVLTAGATQVVDSLLLFGGTECTTPAGADIKSCVGYPPAGLAVILIVSGVLAGGVNGIVSWKADRQQVME